MLLKTRYLTSECKTTVNVLMTIKLIFHSTLCEITHKSTTCRTICKRNPDVSVLTTASLSPTGTQPFWLGFVSFSWLIISAVPLCRLTSATHLQNSCLFFFYILKSKPKWIWPFCTHPQLLTALRGVFYWADLHIKVVFVISIWVDGTCTCNL